MDVRFVDIGGIVDHRCLHFLFIILQTANIVKLQAMRVRIKINMGECVIVVTPNYFFCSAISFQF